MLKSLDGQVEQPFQTTNQQLFVLYPKVGLGGFIKINHTQKTKHATNQPLISHKETIKLGHGEFHKHI